MTYLTLEYCSFCERVRYYTRHGVWLSWMSLPTRINLVRNDMVLNPDVQRQDFLRGVNCSFFKIPFYDDSECINKHHERSE